MVDDPYQAGPLPDPPADPDGIIRPAPHAHELASAAETERVVVASLIAGGEQYLTTWLHLTLRSYLAALRAVAARGLGLLASMTLTGLAEAQAAGRRPEVPNWVHRAIEASWATELDADVLTQAWLAEYHDRGKETLAAEPDPGSPLHIGAQQAVVGSELMVAELDGDSVRLRRTQSDAASPELVREGLVQLLEAVVDELAALAGSDRGRVLQALGSRDEAG